MQPPKLRINTWVGIPCTLSDTLRYGGRMPFGREPHAAHEGKPRAGDAKTVYTSQPLARGGLAVVR